MLVSNYSAYYMHTVTTMHQHCPSLVCKLIFYHVVLQAAAPDSLDAVADELWDWENSNKNKRGNGRAAAGGNGHAAAGKKQRQKASKSAARQQHTEHQEHSAAAGDDGNLDTSNT